MHLSFDCPTCQSVVRTAVSESTEKIECGDCGWSRPVPNSDEADPSPRSCLVCGCVDLWRQKDFPPRVGLTVVGLGMLLSTIAWYFRMPKTAFGVLMGCALLDLVLYTLMKDVLVCYRCSAQHRRYGTEDSHPKFDLEIAERYRQEASRLSDAQKETS